MTSRGKTTFVFALFGAVVSFFTVAAVALIVTGRHSDAVDEADLAAKRFTVAMATYDDGTTRQLEGLQGESDFARVLEAVDSQLARAPKLERLSGYGPENSTAYQAAATVRPNDVLWSLRDTVEVAMQEQMYVAEARAALLEAESSKDADPLAGQTIPTLKALQATYEQVSVPAAAEKADAQIRSMFDLVINRGGAQDPMAEKPVDGQDPVPSYEAAKTAVDEVGKNARAKVAAALKAATS